VHAHPSFQDEEYIPEKQCLHGEPNEHSVKDLGGKLRMGQFLTTIKTDGKKQKQRYELAGRL
jgi:hypothetical protein